MNELPKHLGTYQNTDVFIHDSRFGFVVKWGEKYYTIREDDITSMSINKAIEVIEAYERQNVILGYYKNIPYKKRRSPFGWVLKYDNLFVGIPKEYDVNNLSEDDVHKIIQDGLDRNLK